MIQVVTASSQKGNQCFHILQIQIDAVSVQCHFPKIGSHAPNTQLIHFFMDSLYFFLRCQEVNILIPFNDGVISTYTAHGNGSELEALYEEVKNQDVGGGTDMYTATVRGIELLKEYDLSQYTPAIILLTDGQSGGSFPDFESAYGELGAEVPVFSIMFGDADETQLEELAQYTNARVFDGRENLTEAFRSVKGYN